MSDQKEQKKVPYPERVAGWVNIPGRGRVNLTNRDMDRVGRQNRFWAEQRYYERRRSAR